MTREFLTSQILDEMTVQDFLSRYRASQRALEMPKPEEIIRQLVAPDRQAEAAQC